MAKVFVRWRIESYDEYESELDVPEDMTTEEFTESVNADPDEYLPDLEDSENNTGGGVTERYVEEINECAPVS
jgi:hypothetical protein